MTWRKIARWLVVLEVLGTLVWLGIQFSASAETQMRKAHQKFITALENRKWSTIDGMVSPQYNDGAQDAATVKASMRKVLQGFFALSINSDVVEAKVVKSQGNAWLGEIKTKIKLEGNGAGFSSMVVSQANSMKKPWSFHWHKRGFWPWNWELVQIYNADLMIPDGALEKE